MPKRILTALILLCMLTTARSQDSKPLIQDSVVIYPREIWKAQEAKEYKNHIPVRITIHHEGGRVLKETDDAKQRLKNIQTWCMGPDRKWTDIPYHYLIAPDGSVYEGRNVLTVGETNTDYDPTGHLLISFLGNYNEQELNPHLVHVLVNLISHFSVKYQIEPETISTHKDHCKHTNCPGKNIAPYFENNTIKNLVKAKLKSI